MSLTDPTTLKIDESHPLLYVTGGGWEKVDFVNSGKFIDKQNIIALLKRLDLGTVKKIYISAWSCMDTLWVLPFFKNVESIVINSSNIVSIHEIAAAKILKRLKLDCPNLVAGALKHIEGIILEALTVINVKRDDIDSIGSLLSLKYLEVIGWPESDFASLRKLRLESLIVQESKSVISTAGLELMRMGVARFAWCRELSSLEFINCSKLDIVSCKKIKLDSLASIKTLEHLSMFQNGIVNFEKFLTQCQKLKTLSVGASKIANLSSKSFPTNKSSLKAVSLSLTNKELKEIVPILPPGIVFGNGKLYFKNGINCLKEEARDLFSEGQIFPFPK
jgi:Leucine-rich repeat (LRR) protein